MRGSVVDAVANDVTRSGLYRRGMTVSGPDPTGARPARAVRIGVQLQPQHGEYDDLCRAVDRAEAMGVDIIFNWDHFSPLSGDPEGKHFECWTTLGAWAQQTSRVQIGPLVTCNSYRNPQLLADMARTVDHISGGRLILGMGSGWFEKDYTEYGYAFGTAGSRLDQLRDNLPRIQSRLDRLNPAPTRHIPILIGGGGQRKTLRLVARHADIWHGFDQLNLARKLQVLRGHCVDEGRDMAQIEVSIGVGLPGREGDKPRSAEQEGAPLLALGATLFTVGIDGPSYDLSGVQAWLDWRDEVNAT